MAYLRSKARLDALENRVLGLRAEARLEALENRVLELRGGEMQGDEKSKDRQITCKETMELVLESNETLEEYFKKQNEIDGRSCNLNARHTTQENDHNQAEEETHGEPLEDAAKSKEEKFTRQIVGESHGQAEEERPAVKYVYSRRSKQVQVGKEDKSSLVEEHRKDSENMESTNKIVAIDEKAQEREEEDHDPVTTMKIDDTVMEISVGWASDSEPYSKLTMGSPFNHLEIIFSCMDDIAHTWFQGIKKRAKKNPTHPCFVCFKKKAPDKAKHPWPWEGTSDLRRSQRFSGLQIEGMETETTLIWAWAIRLYMGHVINGPREEIWIWRTIYDPIVEIEEEEWNFDDEEVIVKEGFYSYIISEIGLNIKGPVQGWPNSCIMGWAHSMLALKLGDARPFTRLCMNLEEKSAQGGSQKPWLSVMNPTVADHFFGTRNPRSQKHAHRHIGARKDNVPGVRDAEREQPLHKPKKTAKCKSELLMQLLSLVEEAEWELGKAGFCEIIEDTSIHDMVLGMNEGLRRFHGLDNNALKLVHLIEKGDGDAKGSKAITKLLTKRWAGNFGPNGVQYVKGNCPILASIMAIISRNLGRRKNHGEQLNRNINLGQVRNGTTYEFLLQSMKGCPNKSKKKLLRQKKIERRKHETQVG